MTIPDIIIAVDGYSSTGKSTFAKMVAAEFSFLYLDSGAMYRGVTLFAMENGMIAEDGTIRISCPLSGLVSPGEHLQPGSQDQVLLKLRYKDDEKGIDWSSEAWAKIKVRDIPIIETDPNIYGPYAEGAWYPTHHFEMTLNELIKELQEMQEIEVILGELPYVAESIVLQRDHRIVALIVPNMDALDKAGIGADGLDAVMRQNIAFLNSKLPGYSAVNDFELRFEPFSKTPKGSIRRFMYK